MKPASGTPPVPNYNEGWGRINLSESTFPSNPKVIRFEDNSTGLNTAHNLTYQYDVIDNSDGFYKGHAKKDSRSLMNVTFNLPTAELEEKCVSEGLERGFVGLKGHRSVGGMRASIYNAMTIEGVQALTEFMKEFQEKNH